MTTVDNVELPPVTRHRFSKTWYFVAILGNVLVALGLLVLALTGNILLFIIALLFNVSFTMFSGINKTYFHQ